MLDTWIEEIEGELQINWQAIQDMERDDMDRTQEIQVAQARVNYLLILRDYYRRKQLKNSPEKQFTPQQNDSPETHAEKKNPQV